MKRKAIPLSECLYCLTPITYEKSHRLFCLKCGKKFYKELRELRALDLGMLNLKSLLYFKK